MPKYAVSPVVMPNAPRYAEGATAEVSSLRNVVAGNVAKVAAKEPKKPKKKEVVVASSSDDDSSDEESSSEEEVAAKVVAEEEEAVAVVSGPSAWFGLGRTSPLQN